MFPALNKLYITIAGDFTMKEAGMPAFYLHGNLTTSSNITAMER
jgi:hypothetical protein